MGQRTDPVGGDGRGTVSLADEVAAAATEAEDYLPETGRLRRLTLEADKGGGRKEVWTESEPIPCRVSTTTRYGKKSGERVEERSTVQLAVPAGTGLSEGDRFRVEGRGEYEVVKPMPRSFEVVELARVMEAFE